jgi:putative ABC transport system substrate-binding protein
VRLATVVLALLILAAPLVARAQQTGKPGRIGLLFVTSPSAATSAFTEALRSSLRDLGYVDGRMTIEFRSAEGRVERLPALATQLVERNVDVIVTGGVRRPPAWSF